ncbi:hypothetical protein [Mycobacterium xenopi]|uniref:hypothetical protein n=1 Tax=Mycobacterium xenopi TaxID=1789 RepID=UPI000A1538BA|nr:hypothetical protein [Mycobacterium xenopi]ORX13071.1 hypothetical protein AWC32_15730 [Mycobacterium xenopi]SPX94927.1 Uncharacterised protein [Mycobacterium xenopi]
MTPVLRELLRQRHLHEFSAFAAEYRRIARDLGLPRDAEPPTKATYYYWLSGQMRGTPRGYHCLVLEQMFAGWTAKDLFACGDIRRGRGAHTTGLLASISPAVDPALLAGLWVTTFDFNNIHHVDLSTITVNNNVVSAKNSPPEPRTEGQTVGYHNDINLSLFGRHLIGQWRNTSDQYFYGCIHLAVLPGETIMDGYHTAVLTDTEVTTGRWRWVRVEANTAAGIDLTAIKLGEPRRLYDAITAHPHYGPPIPLAHLTEAA